MLRGVRGFDGLMVPDWLGSRSTARAGLAIEMPGPLWDRAAKLNVAVERAEAVVRGRERVVSRLMERTGALRDSSREGRAEDRPEHRALIRRAGAEGAVRLAHGGTLPLRDPARVAVIGPNARVAQVLGAWEPCTRGTILQEGRDEVMADLAMGAGRPCAVEADFTSRDSEPLSFPALAVDLGRPEGEAGIAAGVGTATRPGTGRARTFPASRSPPGRTRRRCRRPGAPGGRPATRPPARASASPSPAARELPRKVG